MAEQERALIRKALSEIDGSGSQTLCASFEVPGGEKIWIQTLVDTLNIRWPHNENPMLGLGRLELEFPPRFELTTWQPEAYATFNFRPIDGAVHARFIDALFTRFYGCSEDGYPLKVDIHSVGG